MDDLLVALCKQAVPQICNRLRGRLGSTDVRIFRLTFVKFFLGQVDILLKGFSVDHKWHRQHINPHGFCLLLGNSAVAVRYDCNFHTLLFLLPGYRDPV